MIDYQIVFRPTLKVDANEFVSTWNDSPKCSEVVKARIVDDLSSISFDIDPALLKQGLVFLSGMVGGVALEVIKDLVKDQVKAYLKHKFSKKQPKIEIDALRQPDGKYLLVVKEEE